MRTLKMLSWITLGIRTICGMVSSSSGYLRPNRSTIHRNDILPNNPPTANIDATIDASSMVIGPLGRRVSFVSKTRKLADAQTMVKPNESPNTFAETRNELNEVYFSNYEIILRRTHTTQCCHKLSSNFDVPHLECVCLYFSLQ